MSFRRGIALHQLDHADHQQDGRPGVPETDQEHYAQSYQDRGPHHFPGAAALAAAHHCAPDETPLLRKQPDAKENQDERPEAIDAEREQSDSV